MCILFFLIHARPDVPFIVLSNRDEFYCRKTFPLHNWGSDATVDVIGGRDGLKGGSWLAFSPSTGRFAAITNVRHADFDERAVLSRGSLLTEFLVSNDHSLTGEQFFKGIASRGSLYGKMNMVAGTIHPRVDLWWWSNAASLASAPLPRRLQGPFHVLTNAALDTPWPKACRGLAMLRAVFPCPAAGEAPFGSPASAVALAEHLPSGLGCAGAAAVPTPSPPPRPAGAPAASAPPVSASPVSASPVSASSNASWPTAVFPPDHASVVLTGRMGGPAPGPVAPSAAPGSAAGCPVAAGAMAGGDDCAPIRVLPATLEEVCFSVLADGQLAPAAAALPADTGCPALFEYALSGIAVAVPEIGYGTRQSTVLAVSADGAFRVCERTVDAPRAAPGAGAGAGAASPYADAAQMMRDLAAAFRRRADGDAALAAVAGPLVAELEASLRQGTP